MGRDKPSLLHRSDAVREGLTDAELLGRLKRRELVRVARGSYLRESEHRHLDALDQHLTRVLAAAHRNGDGVVFSHVSAAVLHGYDLWDCPVGEVHLTQGGGHGTRRHGLHRHHEKLEPGEIVSIGGLQVTSAARTIADLARMSSLKASVVAGDCALRRGLSPGLLTDTIFAAKGRRGAAKARQAVALMDGRSESVGESLSRLLIAQVRLPEPDLQKHVWGAGGSPLGRTDFHFPGRAVVGEFDGKVKYGKYLKPGQEPGDAVYLEKVREDRIRDTGLVVVRWTWADLSRPNVFRRRILEAFERGRKEISLNPALADL
ncbi:hypothetical protein [Tomitella biformata]|uniref:hypothetical protein n=1 Tax=Tomitella biformata TaxID=630403 RepID=UPI000463B68C|nr:hypothetical protein [Tomitella biformata]